MPVKTFRPLTPSTRYVAYADYSDITKAKPEKSLVEIRKRSGGRNMYGRCTARGIGGGRRSGACGCGAVAWEGPRDVLRNDINPDHPWTTCSLSLPDRTDHP